MSKVVNLRQARKSRTRDQARRQGDANAAKFGRSKAEAHREKVETERAARSLDAHRIESDDGGPELNETT